MWHQKKKDRTTTNGQFQCWTDHPVWVVSGSSISKYTYTQQEKKLSSDWMSCILIGVLKGKKIASWTVNVDQSGQASKTWWNTMYVQGAVSLSLSHSQTDGQFCRVGCYQIKGDRPTSPSTGIYSPPPFGLPFVLLSFNFILYMNWMSFWNLKTPSTDETLHLKV